MGDSTLIQTVLFILGAYLLVFALVFIFDKDMWETREKVRAWLIDKIPI